MFHKNIIKNDSNHKNYDATISQSYHTYFNSIGKRIHTLPRCGLVTKQIVRHILCSINFRCGFLCRCVFFFTNAVFQSCRFYTGSIVLYPMFKFQYLMNYSSDFNNFLQILIASSLYYTAVVIRRPEIWGPNFYSPFF